MISLLTLNKKQTFMDYLDFDDEGYNNFEEEISADLDGDEGEFEKNLNHSNDEKLVDSPYQNLFSNPSTISKISVHANEK